MNVSLFFPLLYLMAQWKEVGCYNESAVTVLYCRQRRSKA